MNKYDICFLMILFLMFAVYVSVQVQIRELHRITKALDTIDDHREEKINRHTNAIKQLQEVYQTLDLKEKMCIKGIELLNEDIKKLKEKEHE